MLCLSKIGPANPIWIISCPLTIYDDKNEFRLQENHSRENMAFINVALETMLKKTFAICILPKSDHCQLIQVSNNLSIQRTKTLLLILTIDFTKDF